VLPTGPGANPARRPLRHGGTGAGGHSHLGDSERVATAGFARGHVDGLPGHFVALGGWRTTIDAFDNGERPGARRAYLRHGVVPGPSAAGRDTVRARNAHVARATTAVPAPVLVTAGQRSTAQSAVASSDPHAAPVKLPAM